MRSLTPLISTAVALTVAGLTPIAPSAVAAVSKQEPGAQVGMTAFSYVSQSPGTDGQTNVLDSAGHLLPLSPSNISELNSDRAAEGLPAIPVVSATAAAQQQARIRSTGDSVFRPFNSVSQTGNCGSAGVDIERASSTSASWYTDWDTFPSVTGPIVSFRWRVSGSKINTKSWDETWASDSWASDVFYPANGKGKYTAGINAGYSYAVGSKSVCYAGSGITATATV